VAVVAVGLAEEEEDLAAGGLAASRPYNIRSRRNERTGTVQSKARWLESSYG
jgi:hypothetical protein